MEYIEIPFKVYVRRSDLEKIIGDFSLDNLPNLLSSQYTKVLEKYKYEIIREIGQESYLKLKKIKPKGIHILNYPGETAIIFEYRNSFLAIAHNQDGIIVKYHKGLTFYDILTYGSEKISKRIPSVEEDYAFLDPTDPGVIQIYNYPGEYAKKFKEKKMEK